MLPDIGVQTVRNWIDDRDLLGKWALPCRDAVRPMEALAHVPLPVECRPGVASVIGTTVTVPDPDG